MQDRSLPQLDDLYKEIILEHYRSPHGRIPLTKVDYHAEGMNPLCGDEVKLGVKLKDGKIERVHIEGHGCSISIASSSMLAQILEGKTLDEAKSISWHLKNIMHNKTNVIARSDSDEAIPIDLTQRDRDCFAPNGARNDKLKFDIGDLEALEGVKKFPVRIKCALLPWTTFEEAILGHEHVEIS